VTLVKLAHFAKISHRSRGRSADRGVRFSVRTPLTTPIRALLLVFSSAVCVTQACADDPFQPGLRWRATPNAALPAVPKSATFAMDANFVFTISNGPFTRLQLFSAFQDGLVPAPLASFTPTNTTGALAVASADSIDALFALTQVLAPDSTHRATLVSRYSAIAAAANGNLSALWTFDSGIRANGPARLGCDAAGTRVFVANWNGPTPEVRFDVLDATTGASLANTMIFAAALNEMNVAADGTRIALGLGRSVWIVDGNANLRHQEIVPLATSGLSLSGDGAVAAIGGTRVRVLIETATTYVPAFEVSGNLGEVATRVALSRDARTLAIGWWNATNGVDARFEIIDVATQTRLFQRQLTGVVGGLQNAPEIVRVTPNGERAALGAWGDGTNAPEILLYDRATNSIRLEADTLGSVFALDLDRQGTKLSVGVKGAHANQFAASGEFRLHDTGESDTTVLKAPRPASTMDVAAKKTGASVVAFLSGPRALFPSTIPGVPGVLALDRSQLILVRRPADATGRADLTVVIPNDPLLIGTYRHLQSAFLINGSWTLGASVVDVLVH